MQLRKATEKDLSTIMAIIADGIHALAQQQSPQWQNGHGPSEEQFLADILHGWTYVLEEETIVAVASIIPGIDPVYEAIDGRWLTPTDSYVSIHRFAVKSATANKGLGKRFLANLVAQCVTDGITDIRIDTHRLNIGMQKVALACGFVYCGEVVFPIPDGERLAYQWQN